MKKYRLPLGMRDIRLFCLRLSRLFMTQSTSSTTEPLSPSLPSMTASSKSLFPASDTVTATRWIQNATTSIVKVASASAMRRHSISGPAYTSPPTSSSSSLESTRSIPTSPSPQVSFNPTPNKQPAFDHASAHVLSPAYTFPTLSPTVSQP